MPNDMLRWCERGEQTLPLLDPTKLVRDFSCSLEADEHVLKVKEESGRNLKFLTTWTLSDLP